MQMKIKEKMIAVVMAFAMMFTFIFAGESSEVIAAAKTKALEINVDFARNAASGDDSGIYVKSLISNKKITFGKTYVFQTKIYVPAVYMKTGRIWVKPAVNFFTGKNGDTYAGMAQSSKEGYSYDKNSKEVKKYGDFYVVNVKYHWITVTGFLHQREVCMDICSSLVLIRHIREVFMLMM